MKKFLFFLICVLSLGSASLQAATSRNDLLVAARALGFMTSPLTGNLTAGIVYDPSIARSAADAKNIQSIMQGGFRVGNTTLTPVLVPISEAGSASAQLFILAEGTGGSASTLASICIRRRMLCMTADINQVNRGSCALGVQSNPKVEILVNRNSAMRSGIEFSTAFRMMITEV